MGHKIFISYKFKDNQVYRLNDNYLTTVRDYVNILEDYIRNMSDNIYKAESEGEDLSHLSDDTIWENLKDKIVDSTLTIVIISKGMREVYKTDKDQWIPWEVRYSLLETKRKNSNGDPITSPTNALLGVVLPDNHGSYDYFISDNNCCDTSCVLYKTNFLFDILKRNMFNIKRPNCDICSNNSIIYHGESSFFKCVKWSNFIKAPEEYIQKAYDILGAKENYSICRDI